MGLVAGILIAVLPVLLRRGVRWLAEPGGLPRLVAGEIGAAIVRVAAMLLEASAGPFRWLGALLRGPALLARFVGEVATGVAAAQARAAMRLIATPLGLANLAALGVIAVNLADLDFAAPIAFLGLGLLILVLLVSENEAAQEAEEP